MDKRLLTLIPLVLAALWLSNPQGALTQELAPATVLGPGFTYQGYLKDAGGNPIQTTCNLRFSLWDAVSGGTQIGANSTVNGVSVSQGHFSALVNAGNEFGSAAFDNANARWLEVAVQCVGDGGFTALSPRQPVSRSLDTHDHLGQDWVGAGRLTLINTVPTGATYGLYSSASSASGYGVFGIATSSAGSSTWGVYGESNSPAGFGVQGVNTTTSGIGVDGRATGTTGLNYGVFGNSFSTDGRGVSGLASATSGATIGVLGKSLSDSGYGVFGHATTTTGFNFGVYGRSDATSGKGVTGNATATNGYAYGVYGQSSSITGTGVLGWATATTGVGYGVSGIASSPDGFAGHFSGNVHVSGILTKTGGAFKIDHPLDPAKLYLYHSFVESPEMKNVYDGVATLDENGQALVQMPGYFEALNQDFRYQLTPIGSFAPLYVARGVQNNRFLIAGGTPNMQVSWQVTGVRHDPWAVAHRIPVEQPKSISEQGKYLYPELYGQPADQAIGYMASPDVSQLLSPAVLLPATSLPAPLSQPLPIGVPQPN